MAERYARVTAGHYDATYAVCRSTADVELYRALARESGGPVLELGCGTGRVLLPIARDGHPCTGIDASDEMLDVLRAKSPPPNLHVVRAAMQDFDLAPARFALVCSAFRAFQHLERVEDQLACLACVRRHLAPGGRFAFDVFNPALASIALAEEPEKEDVRFTQDGDEVVRYYSVVRDIPAQTQRVRFRYERRRGGRVIGEEHEEIGMRWFFRFELEHLLARAGFAVEALWGDFDRRPFAGDPPEIVIVACAAD